MSGECARAEKITFYVRSTMTEIKEGGKINRKKNAAFNACSSAASNNNTKVMVVLDITENFSSCAEHQGSVALWAFKHKDLFVPEFVLRRRKS